jgi:hypothetical protein
MHGGEVDEGYCIVNYDAFEDSVTQISRRQKNSGYFERIDEVTELNDGYCFHFPGKSEPMEKLLELIKVERKNNPSIEFEVIVQKNETVLEIRGDAVKAFVNKLRQPNFHAQKTKNIASE